MKKILAVVLFVICLFAVGCQKNGIATIDSADTLRMPLRMINAEGKLFYDSGIYGKAEARCGTMDGRLKKVGVADEVPQNDGECNFDGATGYQNATSISKEVLIDGKWVVFKLFEDPELDMSDYKYCFYIKGRLPNAEKESELVVLTEDMEYDFKKWANIILQSKYNPEEQQYKSTFKSFGNDDEWGITLYGKDISNTGLTLCVEQFGGKPSGELQTGAAFCLEKYKAGKWEAVSPLKHNDYAWNDLAYGIPENEITELKMDWEWLYGKLPAGNYRIGKEITDFCETAGFDKKIYYFQFVTE